MLTGVYGPTDRKVKDDFRGTRREGFGICLGAYVVTSMSSGPPLTNKAEVGLPEVKGTLRISFI